MINTKTLTQVSPELLSQIRKYGKFDVNGCLNCGSCSVSCNMTDDTATFPRKAIQYGLLGLKEPLINSLDPWLCYYCGDCSTNCPRQTEPAEAMMTLRRFLISQYDWSGISSKVYKSKIWRIGALFITGIFVLLLFLWYHLTIVEFPFEDLISTPLELKHMFGKITDFTTFVFLIPLFLLFSNIILMFWFTLHRHKKFKIPLILYFTELKILLFHTFTQARIKECLNKIEWIKHLLLFSSFILMSIITLLFLDWFQTDEIYPIYHPQRWLGYIATFGLLWGSTDILISRIKKVKLIHKYSELSDWTLPILLFLTAISGIAIHIFRYLELPMYSHFSYLLHLIIVVPLLVIEIPFGKLSHFVYRPLAMYFHGIKEKALELQKSKR